MCTTLHGLSVFVYLAAWSAILYYMVHTYYITYYRGTIEHTPHSYHERLMLECVTAHIAPPRTCVTAHMRHRAHA